MQSQKQLRALTHEFKIECPGLVVSIAKPERRHYGAVDHAVEISLSQRRVSGMEIIIHNFCFHHAQVFSDVSVDGSSEFLRSDRFLQTHARNLPFSMNTGVRPARSM